MQSSNLVLLSDQLALTRSMDVVANNVANASTTGFKREGIEFDTLLSKLGNNKQPLHFVIDRATYRDTSNGPIAPTGNPLDLAISGSGYFRVKMADGTNGYTRAGSFQIDNQGQLVTQAGLPVLDDAGQSITFPNTTTQINIAGDGSVSARVDNSNDLARLGKIGVVTVANEQDMQSAGNNTYTTTQQTQPATESSIVQGSIEQSNVQPVKEITNMIQIMRNYEMVTNMISTNSERLKSANDRLSKTTA